MKVPENCKAAELEENYKTKRGWHLVKCPICERLNYPLSISTGRCSWCGYYANEEDKWQSQ